MQMIPELYQPNVHVCVRLPFESTKVSFANTIPNVLTPSVIRGGPIFSVSGGAKLMMVMNTMNMK